MPGSNRQGEKKPKHETETQFRRSIWQSAWSGMCKLKEAEISLGYMSALMPY